MAAIENCKINSEIPVPDLDLDIRGRGGGGSFRPLDKGGGVAGLIVFGPSDLSLV